HDPAVVRRGIAVRTEAYVYDPAQQQKPGTLQMLSGHKPNVAVRAAVAQADHLGFDDHGGAKTLRAAREVERMQPVIERAVFKRRRNNKDSPGGWVNDG